MSLHIFSQDEAWTKEWKGSGKTVLEVILNNIDTYCRKQIERPFARDEAAQSTYIIIAEENKSIKGFAFLEKQAGKTLYLHLICSAVDHPMKRRSREEFKKGWGGAMIRRIKSLAREKGCKYVKLSALPSVITLYHYFGWRFINKCGQTEKAEITELIKKLSRERKEDPDLKKIKRPDLFDDAFDDFLDKSTTWAELREKLEKNNFSGARTALGHSVKTIRRTIGTDDQHGIDYSPADLRTALPSREEAEEEEGIEETRELAIIDTEEHGYDMLYCLEKKKGRWS